MEPKLLTRAYFVKKIYFEKMHALNHDENFQIK